MMSDGKGPTFDEVFDDLDELLECNEHQFPRAPQLRTFLATVRSELALRQRLIDLERKWFDALRDDYEKAQVALASTRLAMVEMDRVVRERDALRSEIERLRAALTIAGTTNLNLHDVINGLRAELAAATQQASAVTSAFAAEVRRWLEGGHGDLDYAQPEMRELRDAVMGWASLNVQDAMAARRERDDARQEVERLRAEVGK